MRIDQKIYTGQTSSTYVIRSINQLWPDRSILVSKVTFNPVKSFGFCILQIFTPLLVGLDLSM